VTPAEVTPGLLRRIPLPQPASDDDKDGRGRVLVIGGAAEVPGAVMLAGIAALRAGAGKLQLATVKSVAAYLGIAVPEARVIGLPETSEGAVAREAAPLLPPFCDAADCVLLGPGMLDPETTDGLLRALICKIGGGPALVLDAGGLGCIRLDDSLLRHRGGRVVLTPHAGEMARLLDREREAVVRDACQVAAEAAARFGAVVALKGAKTYVATPDGKCFVYRDGSVGLATAGSGDTLAGIVAGLLARGADPLEATLWAVWLHGAAGTVLAKRHGTVGFLARELLAEIPGLMHGLSEPR